MRRCLALLTATIDPAGMVATARQDPELRLLDYTHAIHTWIDDPRVERIVIGENSGHRLSELIDSCEARNHRGLPIEWIETTPQVGASPRGKGYGEGQIITEMFERSNMLKEYKGVIAKCSGRYRVLNLESGLDVDWNDTLVRCDLTRGLTWAKSVCFFARVPFYTENLVPRLADVDESIGVYFETVLARAVHAVLADGGGWGPTQSPVQAVGVSGTTGAHTVAGPLTRGRRELFHRLKYAAIRRK